VSLLAALRQFAQPKEFRIAAPAPRAVLDALERVARAVSAPPPAVPPADAPPLEPPAAPAGPDERLLAELGTGLWRLRQRMVDPSTGEPTEVMRRAFRHLQSVWDALAAAGVEIQDHTGSEYDPGLSIQVLAFQPMPELEREKVIETVKPTVYYRGRRLQMGDVIVGTPEPVGGTDQAAG
jgi:hypothetical protein